MVRLSRGYWRWNWPDYWEPILIVIAGEDTICRCVRFIHESGAVERLSAVIEEIVPDKIARRVVIVADTRTWSVGGGAST